MRKRKKEKRSCLFICDTQRALLEQFTTRAMSTIQSLKNFIRHGKQARVVTPHAEPTTNVSPVHAQQERQPQGRYSPAAGGLDAIDSKLGNHSSTTSTSNQAAAQSKTVAAEQSQSPQPSDTPQQQQSKRNRDAEIERIVAEERQMSSQMPNYPGLERWMLLEKMGDGAFSNVYRAKDTMGDFDQVAIKVVRKFEMNSSQVGQPRSGRVYE